MAMGKGTKGGSGQGANAGRDQELARAESSPDGIEALFQVPLSEFTAARNTLAAQLKKSGNDAGASRVKTLPKPSISAWAVNQLYWRHRKEFDHLIDTGERFRDAQAAQLAGGRTDVRGPLEARREALATLSRLGADTLESGHHPATPDMMRRVTSTLEALATYGRSHNAPPAGRLTDDIEPPGFETIAALVPRIGREDRGESEPTRVLPFEHHHQHAKARKATREQEQRRAEEERKAQLAAARRALRESERALAQAKNTAAQSEAALKAAAARVKEAERRRATAQKVFDKVAAAADKAKQEARRIASEAENAAQAVEDAERELEKATRELKSLE
jgi:hypothetical protein